MRSPPTCAPTSRTGARAEGCPATRWPPTAPAGTPSGSSPIGSAVRRRDGAPDGSGAAMNTVVRDLLERSNRLGADPRTTNYAGGNTSAKGHEIDPVTGEDVELLWVKGSGGDLGTLTEAGLSVLRLDRLRSLVQVYPGPDREDEMVAAFDFCCHGR